MGRHRATTPHQEKTPCPPPAIPAEIVPEQIEVPAPDAVAVAATDLMRRYGEGDTAVDALRGVSLDVAEGKLTAIMDAPAPQVDPDKTRAARRPPSSACAVRIDRAG
jgi:hypothetical protein